MKEKEHHIKIQNQIKKEKEIIKENINKKEKIESKNEKPKKTKTDFLRKENDNLIVAYGAEVYNYAKEIEELLVCPNMLKNHKMDEKIRTKMVDWMIEVLTAYKSDSQTLFIAVTLMDLFLQKTNTVLENSNMHLIGVTCIYIASKYEDVIPIRMHSIHTKIAHKAFPESQIRQQERSILSVIGWDLFFVTIYDFINTFIFDFIHNNQSTIQELEIGKLIQNFDGVAIFLAKLTLHYEVFSRYLNSLKAIACIIVARDLMLSYCKFNKETDEFLKDWILFLIKESGHNPADINEVYTKINEFYHSYGEMNYINFNLSKTQQLNFD